MPTDETPAPETPAAPETPPPPYLRFGGEITPDSVQHPDETSPRGRSDMMVALVERDGSRRIAGHLWLDAHAPSWQRAKARALASGHIGIHWGPMNSPVYLSLWRNGSYLPYPPADGIPIPTVDTPVNQVPYSLPFLKHTCTFAHEIDQHYADHTLQMRQETSYEMLPDTRHDTESNLRNQIALRVGRGLVGHNFDQALRLHNMPRQGSPDELRHDWTTQLPAVRADVEEMCFDTCAHAYWLRQFMLRLDIVPWANALAEVLTAPAGGGTYMRLPKIDKTGAKWTPSADSVATFAGTAPLNWWKRQMVNFGKAVDYYDDHFGQRPA